MFIVAPEVAEERKVEQIFPELIVEHYPKETILIHWLYCYQASWDMTSRFPFMDRRVVPLVAPHRRLAFIYFTNAFYRRWMVGHEGKCPIWFNESGFMEPCYKCKKQENCSTFCVAAYNKVKVNHSKLLRGVIAEFEHSFAQRGRDADYGGVYLPEAAFVSSFDSSTLARLLTPSWSGLEPLVESYAETPLAELPQDQEEWWTM